MTISIFQSFVGFTFYTIFLAFAGAALFFFFCRDLVHPRYKVNMVVSGVIASIAAYMYYHMKNAYSAGHAFPTEMRYIDWVVTTPLMLTQFSLLLGFSAKSSLVWKLLLCDIVMIIAGYLGECQGAGSTGSQYKWLFLVVGMTAWLGIMLYLYRGIIEQAKLEDIFVKKSVFTLTKFVTFGWLLYPIGYIVRSLQPESGDICQLAYNVGDIVNKLGFGTVIYLAGAAALAESEARSALKSFEAATSATGGQLAIPPGKVMPSAAEILAPTHFVSEKVDNRNSAFGNQQQFLEKTQSFGPVTSGQNFQAELDIAPDLRSMQQQLLQQMRGEADSTAKLKRLRAEVEEEIARLDNRTKNN